MEEELEKVENERIEEFIRAKASNQVSNQLVVEKPPVLSKKHQTMKEQSGEMASKRRKLDVCVRIHIIMTLT